MNMEKDKESYISFVRFLAKTADDRTFLNSDEDHALSVLVQMFMVAKKTVRIFAGSLCKHIGNKTDYIVALSEFIERGGKLYILLNDFNENDAKESNLFKRLSYYKSIDKPIFVKTSTAHPYMTGDEEKKEVHFTVADGKAYRIETDIVRRTAECNFNNPIMAMQMESFFDGLFEREDAKVIDILKLFENGDK